MDTTGSGSSAGLHPNVVQSIERLRRHHQPVTTTTTTTRTKHRLALWDVRPLDRKNAKYVVDFLEEQQQDQSPDVGGSNNDNDNVVIVSQLVLAYCDLSLEAVQVFSAHFARSSSTPSSSSRSHLEKVTLSHLRGLGGGGGGGGLLSSSSPLERLLTALSNNASITELCLDNVYLLPLVPAVPAPQHHGHQHNNNNEDANDNRDSTTTTTTNNNNNNALGHLLQSNRHVTTLSCSTTNLALPGVLGMQAGLLVNDTLRELDLNDVNLGNAGLEALVRALVGPPCTTTTHPSSLSTTSTIQQSSSSSSSKSRLQVLSLCQNQISWRGLPSLARLLQQSKFLRSLILRLNRGILDTTRDAPNDDNEAGVAQPPLSAPACRQVFCQALRDNKTLTMLSLSDCSVRGTSAAMVVQALAAASSKKQQQQHNDTDNNTTGNTTLQILEMDGFRLDSDVHVCRTWAACLPSITGLRHLTIHLDFGRHPALLASLQENLSLETISRRRDASSSSSSGTSNSNSSGGRRLVRSNSIGSEGSSSSSSSATTAAAEQAVHCVLERNRLARLAQESFGFPPPPTRIAPSIHDDGKTTRVASIITPGILYQSILRVTGAGGTDDANSDEDDGNDEDGTSAGAATATSTGPNMNAAGMAHVLYQILRPRIDVVLSQQLAGCCNNN